MREHTGVVVRYVHQRYRRATPDALARAVSPTEGPYGIVQMRISRRASRSHVPDRRRLGVDCWT